MQVSVGINILGLHTQVPEDCLQGDPDQAVQMMQLVGLAGVVVDMQGQRLLLQKPAVAAPDARWLDGSEGCSEGKDRKCVVMGQG